MARNTRLMRFCENVVDAFRNVGTVEQSLQQIDFCALYVHLDDSDSLIETFEVVDEVYLANFDSPYFCNISLVGDKGAGLRVQGGILLELSMSIELHFSLVRTRRRIFDADIVKIGDILLKDGNSPGVGLEVDDPFGKRRHRSGVLADICAQVDKGHGSGTA